jgi:hypothetical protein
VVVARIPALPLSAALVTLGISEALVPPAGAAGAPGCLSPPHAAITESKAARQPTLRRVCIVNDLSLHRLTQEHGPGHVRYAQAVTVLIQDVSGAG